MSTNFISIAALIFIIGMVAMIWKNRNKDQSSEDFHNMSQTGTWVYICGCYTATVLSSAGMVGLPGLAYTHGFLIGILNWGCTIAFIASGLFLGPRIRKFGTVTFGEFYETRFESPKMRTLVSLVTTIGVAFYFMGQSIGSATVLEQVLQIPYKGAVVFSIVLVMFIAYIGGAESSTKMDTIQCYIMALGLGIVFAPAVMFLAGFDKIAAMAAAKPELFRLGGTANIGMGSIIGYIVLWAFGFTANPVNLTRAFIARDDREWLKGLLAGFAIVSVLIWTMEFAGISIRAINPDFTVGDRVIPWAVLNLFGPIIGFISALALTSDSLTTADTQLLVIGQSIARDVVGYFKKDLSEAASVKITKAGIIVVGVLGIIFAMSKLGFIYAFAQFGSSVFAAAFFPSLVMGLFNKNITKQAAGVSIFIGLVIDFVLQAYPMWALGQPFGYAKYLPYQIHPVLWALAGSTISLLVVNAFTKPTETQIENFNKAVYKQVDKTGQCSDASVIKFAIAVLVIGTIQYAFVLALASLVG